MFSFKNNNLLPVLPNIRCSSNNSSILFTNARDEPNIAEWVAHHLLLGFDKIVIFDHLSKIPISTSIGSNFNGRLTIIPIQGNGNIKIKLMNDALDIATRENHDWMLYLDADEYINLNRFDTIKDFLDYFHRMLFWLAYQMAEESLFSNKLVGKKQTRQDLVRR